MRLIDADAFKEYLKNAFEEVKHVYTDGGVFAWRITEDFCRDIDEQPTINVKPERLTNDDFETIRIHLNAQKEKLCNQQRWEEAEEYQRIIDRFMAFASAQPEIIRCGQCKYAEAADSEDNQDGYTCQFHRGSIWFSGSYCSWAERREECTP